MLCLGVLLTGGGVLVVWYAGGRMAPLFLFGLMLSLGGAAMLVTGLCIAMRKNFQVSVPGHFLLHPRTGTRYSPHQALTIQRRLDRMRREMSEDSVTRAEPELPLPGTPPPWDMEPPPSYDTVMKSQGQLAPQL